MARVPGLYPERQGGQNITKRIGGRAQGPEANSLRTPGLAPVASPVDTYARPSQPPQGNSLLQLAETLGAINPALQKFAQTFTPDPKDAYADAQRLVQTTPRAELEKRIASGDIPEEFKTLEGMRVRGEEAAFADRQAITDIYNGPDYDKANGNIDELITQRANERIKSFGNDRALIDAYTKNMAGFREKLFSADAEYKTNEVQVQRTDSSFSVLQSRIDEARESGADEATLGKLGADWVKSNKMLGIHPKDSQKLLLEAAEREMVRGNWSVAEAIITTEREDGAYKGSLQNDRELGGKATDMLAKINTERLKAQAEQTEVQQKEAIYSTALDAMRKGSPYALEDQSYVDKNGETKTISADDMRKEGAKREKMAIEADAQRLLPDNEEGRRFYTLKRQKEFFLQNSIDNPQWTKTINNGFAQMSLNGLSKEGNLPPGVLDGYALYKQLVVESPGYASKFSDSKAIDFYEAARIVEEDGDVGSPDDALEVAFKATGDIKEQPAQTQLLWTDIKAKVDDALDDAPMWAPWWSTEFANSGDAMGEISRRAQLYMRMGKDQESALKLAGEAFKRTRISVADTLIKNDKRMPPDFKPLIEQQLKDVVAKFSKETGIDEGDLTISDVNGFGSWIIVRKATNMPPEGISRADRIITLDTLQALRVKNRTKAEGDLKTNWNSKHR